MNLYEFIKSNKFRGLTLNLLRRIAIQILQALSFMRRHKIIHCDLKPENILLKQPDRSGIKIIDLGSSCFDSEKLYTYIQSRYYRCPEVILGYSYDMAIDMWSFGCIIFELYTGFPCYPGESEKDQLQRIMEVLGKPDDHIINVHIFLAAMSPNSLAANAAL
jgi:dual specificity tyrosine-phosphorylation-regulated kinase 2/3/4